MNLKHITFGFVTYYILSAQAFGGGKSLYVSMCTGEVKSGQYTTSPMVRVLAKRKDFYIFSVTDQSHYAECGHVFFGAKVSDLGDIPINAMWPTREAEFVGNAKGENANGFETTIPVFKPAGPVMKDPMRKDGWTWSAPKGRSLLGRILGR